MPNPSFRSSLKAELIVGPPYAPHAATWTLHGDEIVFFDVAKENDVPAIRACDVRTLQDPHDSKGGGNLY